jgi:hypothetical protein
MQTKNIIDAPAASLPKRVVTGKDLVSDVCRQDVIQTVQVMMRKERPRRELLR